MENGKSLEKLLAYFKERENVIVAFSGGLDSSVLAKAAFAALGEKALAVTVRTQATGPAEMEGAMDVAAKIGIRHVVIDADVLAEEEVRLNGRNRCYHCKKAMYAKVLEVAQANGIKTVADGTNADDAKSARPGLRAIREAGIETPLADLGLDKRDVEGIARLQRLPNAKKPPDTCLLTRIPYGTEVTGELLEKIRKAEEIVGSTEARQVRVRSINNVAVIEVPPEDFGKVLDDGRSIAKRLKDLGFKRVALDLDGYRSGSMD
ncbi:MAG: ATP-dependent sacrificial sulfur transferase LarE [Candidatus Altiarchaeota archaeon]|nr:ATP-dependent sacrificial sulfur transferase LarE [Candidatus Altiarchaeota archaeon]